MSTVTPAALLAFIRLRAPRVGTFITTITRDGRPLVRQVTSLVADDFTVESPCRRFGLRAGHVRRNPHLTMLWVGLTETQPARTVSLVGRGSVVDDEPTVRDFLDRYNAWYGAALQYGPNRALIRVEPELLRAEAFRGNDRSRPVVIRDFTTRAVIDIDEPT